MTIRNRVFKSGIAYHVCQECSKKCSQKTKFTSQSHSFTKQRNAILLSDNSRIYSFAPRKGVTGKYQQSRKRLSVWFSYLPISLLLHSSSNLLESLLFLVFCCITIMAAIHKANSPMKGSRVSSHTRFFSRRCVFLLLSFFAILFFVTNIIKKSTLSIKCSTKLKLF